VLLWLGAIVAGDLGTVSALSTQQQQPENFSFLDFMRNFRQKAGYYSRSLQRRPISNSPSVPAKVADKNTEMSLDSLGFDLLILHF
jgi:hypothetical protein